MSRWEPDAQGRLIQAAVTLFDQQGYAQTTVAGIAEAAGLTKRSFFRYFTDKREVLFKGSPEFEQSWIEGIQAAPAGATAMVAVSGGLDAVAALFAGRLRFAAVRAQIITANPDLREREQMKLAHLTQAATAALVDRGVPAHAATLAAHTGVTVFHVAFTRWVSQDNPPTLQQLIQESLKELRAVITT